MIKYSKRISHPLLTPPPPPTYVGGEEIGGGGSILLEFRICNLEFNWNLGFENWDFKIVVLSFTL